jgi:hypothetical protein
VLNNLTIVNDGEELMQYLRGEGKYAGARMPDLLLLDLNMPRLCAPIGTPSTRHPPPRFVKSGGRFLAVLAPPARLCYLLSHESAPSGRSQRVCARAARKAISYQLE